MLRRILTSAIAIMIVAPVSPAAADPAEPTDYRSVVDVVEPAIAGVTIDVVGGDSFLRVRAEAGHEVVVIGYWDEPYARITADGTVEINQSSPSVLQNERRYGVATEEAIDTTQPPRWEATGSGGELVWHDHRSHWMAPTKPTVGSDGLVQRWELPLVVDGNAVVVRGSLYVHASPTPLWWFVLLPALAAAVLAAAHRPVLLAAIGATVTVVGVVDRISLPADARPAWVAVAARRVGRARRHRQRAAPARLVGGARARRRCRRTGDRRVHAAHGDREGVRARADAGLARTRAGACALWGPAWSSSPVRCWPPPAFDSTCSSGGTGTG